MNDQTKTIARTYTNLSFLQLAVLGVVVLLPVVGIAGYYAGWQSSTSFQDVDDAVEPIVVSPLPSNQSSDKKNWKTYVVDDKVKFKYPPELTVTKGSRGVVFIRNPKTYQSPGPEELLIDASLGGIFSSYVVATQSARENVTGTLSTSPNSISDTWTIDFAYSPGQHREEKCSRTLYKYLDAAIQVSYCEPQNTENIFAQITSTIELMNK